MPEAMRQMTVGAAPAALTIPRPANDVEPALIGVFGVVLEAYPEGALWWDHERLLLVADLHLEKGSSFARRGQMLPPYDTAETLSRLSRLVARLNPRAVACLGDSFHDGQGAERLSPRDRLALASLQGSRDWIWVAGNHDPAAPANLAGQCVETLTVGPLTLRHAPQPGRAEGEIAGHLHPAATVAGRGRWVRRRCFAGDGYRLVMPAFGAYAGGLDVFDAAFSGLFADDAFRVFMLGEDRVYPVGRQSLRST
jgi:DNA ligase-associated metallophosphoesterase